MASPIPASCAYIVPTDEANVNTSSVQETGVAAYVAHAEAPMVCVSMGTGKALENYAIIRRSIGGL
jgi:hypothetical protein